MDVTIYHNPDCGTSRNTLALIRNAGVEPKIVEYLKTPPSRATLLDLIARMGIPARALLREKGTSYKELGLENTALTDEQLVDAMMQHPILINRPVVVTDWGVKLCRPSEAVLDILPLRQRGPFAKEDGEAVIDATGVVLSASPDWLLGATRPTQGKTLAVMKVSGGSQSFNAVNQLRVLGRWMRMFTIPSSPRFRRPPWSSTRTTG
jgi:arsenate reductase (glutaredoxin)